jgi:cell wall-associated NlpC family hydrolase
MRDARFRGDTPLRHCEERSDEASPMALAAVEALHGLLRFARNDGAALLGTPSAGEFFPLNASVLDRRLTPARPDLAAASLRGKVEAARFVEGWRRRVVEPIAPLRRAPTHDAMLETEALYGEDVLVFEDDEGWAWAQLQRDSYVGFIPTSALGPESAPTHKIAILRSFVYPKPSIKAPPLSALPFGARVQIAAQEGEFGAIADGGFIYAQHLAPLDQFEADFVAVAERFLETPYLWGGRTAQGLDCSALIQTALTAAGCAAPRDSDMLEAALGAPIGFDETLAGLKRGDLVFWKGHIGVMRDEATLLHASGWRMRVVTERLRDVRDRYVAKGAGPITSIRRL